MGLGELVTFHAPRIRLRLCFEAVGISGLKRKGARHPPSWDVAAKVLGLRGGPWGVRIRGTPWGFRALGV